MKCVDTAGFYGCWPFRACGETDADVLLDKAGRNGVDTLLLSSVQSIFYQDGLEGEVQLHRALAGHDRAHFIATVNPAVPGWEQDFETVARDFRPVAVKVFPGYHGYSLLSAEMRALCDILKTRELPLILCLRVEDERVVHMVRQQPVPVDVVGQFLGIYREQKIVLSNISFGEIMALKPCVCSRDGVWFDTAGLKFISFPLEKLLGHYSPEQFLFGSQFPLYVQKGILNQIIVDDLPGEVRRAILWDNAAKLFGLENG